MAPLEMVVLPTFIFFFQNMVMTISPKKLEEIQRVCNQFIWGEEKVRIKASVIEQKIKFGGLTVPNIMAYSYAAIGVNVLQ